MHSGDVEYKAANNETEFERGKKLFREYVISLGVDLSFQDFDKELKTVSEQYNKPKGALLIAYIDKIQVGCAGIRSFDNDIAELKRMYVKDEYRGLKIGIGLLERTLTLAKELGYKKIRLDTLENMKTAQSLYKSFGFYQIAPYRFNPLIGTVYMEKEL